MALPWQAIHAVQMRRVPQAAGKLMGILALIVSPLGKLIGILSLIAGVALGGYLLLKQHDADVLANQNLVTQKAIMAQQANTATWPGKADPDQA